METLEALENAYEELKRADHLLYVSLKYTRTVDIIKHIIERLIGSSGFAFDSILLNLQEQKKITDIPSQPLKKAEQLRKYYPEDQKIQEIVDLYLLWRKMDRAEFSRAKEFRRHVTMSVTIDGAPHDIDIDKMHIYFEKTKEFYNHANSIVVPKKTED